MIYFIVTAFAISLFGFGFAFGLFGRLALWIAAESRISYMCKYNPLDGDNVQFKTGCGNDFFNAADDGDDVTSWMSYCPYCGGKVKQLRQQLSGDNQ